ncbi:hypothetical protein [Microvirga roseola]|uniref:hypothetical protein n=1 Tax=Microvirga roseola TaxID=2883126 RepID=UPI001E310963|nr:hypothetical protein [Microvirga roseola]
MIHLASGWIAPPLQASAELLNLMLRHWAPVSAHYVDDVLGKRVGLFLQEKKGSLDRIQLSIVDGKGDNLHLNLLLRSTRSG